MGFHDADFGSNWVREKFPDLVTATRMNVACRSSAKRFFRIVQGKSPFSISRALE